MAALKITSIECLPAAAEWLRGCTIDLPCAGESIDGHVVDVAGWVVGRRASVAAIEILHGTQWLTGSSVLTIRPDVTSYLELTDDTLPTGFQLRLNTIGLPQTFGLSVWAHLTDGQAVEWARVRGTQTLLRSPFRPALQPLSVTSLGRTGTTLLLQMLAEHPEICVHRVYPFAMRLGAYWMHLLAMLTGPAGHFTSSLSDRFEDERPFAVNGPIARLHACEQALPSSFAADAPEEMAALCQRSIDAAYLRLAHGQDEAPGRYFAERNTPGFAARLLSHLYDGAKEVVLVRDFRDVICSMLALDRKRRTRLFQRNDYDDEAFVIRIVDEFRQLLAAWDERRGSALLLRYEDMIADPHQSLRRVAEHAGIDASPPVIERMAEARRLNDEATRAHRTTNDGPQSVGRHRFDMNENLRGLCLEIGADLLSRLGYATDPNGASEPDSLTVVRV